jgi:hypothetical protein
MHLKIKVRLFLSLFILFTTCKMHAQLAPALYQPTTATCKSSSSSPPYGTASNLNAPLSVSSDYASVTSVYLTGSTPHEKKVDCTWSGFPAVTTSSSTFLTFPTAFTVLGSTSAATITITYSVSGSVQTYVIDQTTTLTNNKVILVLPSGTDLSTLAIEAFAQAQAFEGYEAEIDIGSIVVTFGTASCSC